MLYRDGEVAGRKTKRGYVEVHVGRAKYSAHRIAWLFFHGTAPDGDIDHINGVRSDNRICNLRCVSRRVNLENQHRPHRGSTTGFLGVSLSGNRFQAKICSNYKYIYLGTYLTAEEAHLAYLEAKRRLHTGCTI